MRTNGKRVYTSSEAGRNTLVQVPTLVLSAQGWAELREMAEAAAGEVTVFGVVDAVDGELRVGELMIPNQTCSSAGTVVEAQDLADFLDEMLAKGVALDRLRLWAHSHADMSVFWSETDVQAITTAFAQADWVVALVINRRGEARASLRLNRPIVAWFDDIPVQVRLPHALRERIAGEIALRVRRADEVARYAGGGG